MAELVTVQCRSLYLQLFEEVCVCVFCRQPVSLHWVSTHRGRLQDLLPGTKSTSVTKTRYVSYSLMTLIFSGRASALTGLFASPQTDKHISKYTNIDQGEAK